MKLTYNGKEYDVKVETTTDAHKGISMKLTLGDKTYEGPFSVERFHKFLEEK